MNDEERKKYEKELLEDEAYVMEEVNNNPDLKSVTAPPEIHENLFNRIHTREDGTYKRLTDRETELIRLGRIYEKKRKNRKYLALVAVMVLAMAFGITSFGGAEKIFEKVTWMMAGREQSNVDSDDGSVVTAQTSDEEEVYQMVEEKYGFYPVKLDYLPEGVEFQEATISDEIQGANLIYGQNNEANIIYRIRPNYREGSYGIDIEDHVLTEYEKILDNTVVQIKKYQVENETYRWSAQFEYQDVTYYILIMGFEEIEIERIVNNLYFF